MNCVIFVSFSDDGNFELAIQALKLERIQSAKISELPFIVLTGISLSCLPFDVNKFFIPFKAFFLSVNWKSKRDFESHILFIARMLGCFLCLTMTLITGSRISIGSPGLNCGVLRLLIIFEKSHFKYFSYFLIIFYNFISFNQCYFFIRNDFIGQTWKSFVITNFTFI